MKIERKDDVTVYKDWKDLVTILETRVITSIRIYRKIKNIVSHIEEHHFEVLKVKHADSWIESMFFPMKDDAQADIYNEYNEIYRVQALLQTCSRKHSIFRLDAHYSQTYLCAITK